MPSVLRVLLVCIRSYLKSVVRYTFFFILDIYHPDTLYLRGQGCVVRGYFSKPKGARERNKKFEKHCFKRLARRPVVHGCRSW